MSFFYKAAIPGRSTHFWAIHEDEDPTPLVTVYVYNQFIMEIETGERITSNTSAHTSGNWTHVVTSWRPSDGLASMYLNGVLVAQANLTPVRLGEPF